ncbi:receptor-type tyrosine-protein phosphatase beta-like isoform X5 [Anguilla anguilla]|uniref:receptor-type tyrosine-protein phosphatase beta-like isoform X5 n=1 Tax=Anguilla anguilla TaxID=7936 RepID=UPI0015A9E994|nr:receptor-type tyrosine-protein phosphatase beta-like isoform X5 [Anguilla anguilla]
MRGLSFNGVLSTTLLGLWMFFKVSCEQSVLITGENSTTVTTISGPFAEDSESVSNATWPYPILWLNATTINTTVVVLHWHRPQGYQQGYSNRVETSGCTSAPRNQTEQDSMATITGLTPGTNCSFTVYSQVQNGIEGEPISVYQYTKPERVSPTIPNRGTSDTIEVTWLSPPGNVEKYKVNLTSNYGDNQTKFLNSSFQSWLFSGLAAGRNYTVVVTTISGPFAEDSEPVSNATYPNPPGAIHAEGQTTDSITISWGRPQGMDLGQYSFIIFCQPHQNGQNESTNNTAVLENLTSGTLYNISVVTVGPMGYHSSAATAGIYTRPYPILGLNATTINTTVVVLHWHSPQGYQQGYSYRVETSCCMPTPRNQTEQNSMATITDQNSMATITDLIPGTNCSFTVYSQVQNGIEGEPISVYQYTKPERVSPTIPNRGANDTIEVTWLSPTSNVEKYKVNLTSNYGDNQIKFLRSSFQSWLFSGLAAGRNYTAVVTTISGPFAEDSEPVSNATYPNPPGAIHAEGQTTDSITISWGRPQGMDLGQYSFIIFCHPHQNGQNESTNNTAVLENLTSGTLYNISVVTVGPMGYHSSAATAGIYTRPYPILGLNATTINTTVVVLHWHSPQGYQQGYSYRVETSCCMPTPRNQTEQNSMATITDQNSMATITDLIPGTNCSFTVYSQVQNGIEGEPISVYQYTKPERVSPTIPNRGANDTIEVTWLSPTSNVEKYKVNLTSNYGDNQIKFLRSSFQSWLFSGLAAGRNYTAVVTTISGPFAEDSEPVSNATYPNPPGAIHAEGQTTDSITISWGWPQGMDLGQYSFIIFYQASQNETTNNTAVLENLTSGTLYNISVVTVGPMGYHSSAATAGIYTRPYPILGLNATTINTTVVVLHWHRPQGYQLGYSYRVETSCCMPTPRNQTEKNSMATITEQNSMATITDLIPGINCSFTVYSQVQNGVEGEPISVYQYTKPERVSPAVSNRGTNDTIEVTWKPPLGNVEKYMVNLTSNYGDNQSMVVSYIVPSPLFSGLTPGRKYTVVVTTISGPFAEDSEPVSCATWPYPILGLNATTINTTVVVLHWHRPQGYQQGYSYMVKTSGCTSAPRNQTEQDSMATITGLTPGTNCSFTVYSQVQNGIEGEPISVYQYTKPERVSPAVSSRGTNDTIEVTWRSPRGNVEKYMVNLTSNYGDNQIKFLRSSFQSQLFSGLAAGRKYTVVVTTISGPFAEDSEPVSNATWPYPILGLNATTINTTVVVLHWHRPQGYQLGYSYRVETSCCMPTPRNQTEKNSMATITDQNSMATITDLIPGTNCSFTVYSQVQNAIEGEPISVYQYTKPERVSPAVSNRGTNDTIEVTWMPPLGNVEKYMVNLTSNYGDNQSVVVSYIVPSPLFSGLTPGRKYTVVVTTISGPFAEDSEPVSNATYPNPPGAIHAEEQTTDSITISWGRPQGMDLGQYSFIIFCQPHQNGQNESTNNTAVLENLTSGTLYNISVVTVGPMGYHSSAATAGIYTRPYPILGLNATTINTTVVVLHWHRPQGYQQGYLYRVETSGCTSAPRNQTEQDSMATITGLTPGTNCSFTVYSQVQNGIEGEPISVYQYTKPERVNPAISNRGANDTIEVTWMPPPSNVEKYMLSLTSNYGNNQTKFLNSSFQSWLFSGLAAGRKYTVVVTTISGPFAEDSEPVSNATYPNPPGAIHAEGQTTDSITISWGRPQGMDLGQYSFIIFYQPHQNGQTETTNNRAVLENLTSRTLYNISVVTVGPMGYHSSAATAGIYTRPYPILGLNATTINTMVVILHWHRPQGYQQGYSYRVETSGCTSASRNQTEQDSMATITDLIPGTNCSFTVYSQVQNGIEGEPISVYQYTKPERVSPAVSNRGTNDTIEVTCLPPRGNVEKYKVNLTSNYGDNQIKFLSSSFQSQLFSGLAAGRNYTVVVTTISGPFAEDSEPVSSATYPNAPGPITVTNKTTNSVAIEWTPAPGMDRGSFSYHVTYGSSAHDLKSRDTDLNELTVRGLVSGTPYNISVATVGLFQYASQPVLRFVTTRPESVRGLQQSSTTVDMISIAWQRPVGFKPGYSYGVTVRNSTGHLIRDGSTSQLSHNWMGLSPGNRYTFGVTSRTSDGTPGSPVTISVCTDASPVVIFKCDGPNRTGPVLNLAWDSPEGANKGFSLTWGDTGSVTLPPCTGNCRHNIENLSYYTRYQVRITTLGCGETSSVHKTDCQTGITAPPEPSRSTGFAVREKKHNMFVLKFNSSILNSKNGPIVAYGILMTSNLKEFSNENNVGLQKYLNKTHDDWTKDESVPYLATALDTNVEQTRNEKSEFEVNIGSGSRWNGYTNGPLSARTTYRFALVMFTYVALANELVDASRSLFSISKFFDEDVALPENPTVITVGALAGALSAVTCFTAIAAGVYWKKATRKTPSDIPIESMRAKVGAPVRVEDYEAYHRRQSANSNCGFAEEYEELKPVGIGQCKVSAEALENKGKNRYTNVLPYESSRVKLSIQGSPYDDYINASYVPGYNCKKEFIAAQGPLPGTVDEFWRMLWEKNVRTLVMLTRCNEQGRVKCEEYWPSRTKHFKNIFVTTTSVVPLEDWTVRDFDVKNVKTAETRSLRQFHFTAWPDHGVPESTELLIDFRHLVREHMDLVSRNSPTVVHCSAGVGRTGTMIAIDHLLFQIERDSMVDLYGTVYSMRMHRALMVQTEDQYVFLHKCALDIIKSRTGTNVDLIYQNVAAVDIYENVTTIKGAAGVSRP